jgi:AcrR family transcriptional regulator
MSRTSKVRKGGPAVAQAPTAAPAPASYRAPGIARRARLLQAARQLLRTHDLDRLSLADVAAKARIPKGSAYHYYGDILDVYAQLLAVIDEELLEDARRPLRSASIRCWADVVATLIRRAVRYYAADPAARQLILSAKAPPVLKLRDRNNDIQIGSVFVRHFETHFVLPARPRQAAIFYRAVEIADLMFSLSILEHGRITGEMAAEAVRAMVGYLGGYYPAVLPLRPDVGTPAGTPAGTSAGTSAGKLAKTSAREPRGASRS